MGVSLALPFLDAMAPALTAVAKTAAAPVPRLGFFYVSNGIQLQSVIPATQGASYEITPVLTPLAAYRSQMTVVTGLANREATPLESGSGPHTRAGVVWLCGTRAKHTEGADIQVGKTLDQFAADRLGMETPLRSLELALEPNFAVGNCEGGYSCVYLNTFSWRTATTPLPMEINPHTVFTRLFGEDKDGATRLARIRKQQSILDAVTDDVVRLQRTLGPSDRSTITGYLDTIRDVEKRLQNTARRVDAGHTRPDQPLGIPEAFGEHAALMLDLLFLAYQADITRVGTFQMCRELSSRPYPEIGVPDAHHDVSHHQNNPERMAKNTKINVHHMELFSRFIEKLRATPDGDGSLLDHSLMMYGAGMGNGDLHDPTDLPAVLIGGACGQHKGGQHLRFANLPLMNLGLSVLDKVGVELERVGDSTGRLAGL